jgi:hypothetical protein
MSKKPVRVPPSSEGSSSDSNTHGKRGSIIIARVVGILCVAAGFVLGIHGLDHPGSPLLPTALGIILTGLVAQVFALVKSCYVGTQGKG